MPPTMVMMMVSPMPMAMVTPVAMTAANLFYGTLSRYCGLSDPSTSGGHGLSRDRSGEEHRAGSQQGHRDQLSHGLFPF
jgi:hypothetical protein